MPPSAADISRRSALTALATAPVAVSQPPQRKPNFLFIIADDHAGYVLGCDGNAKAVTPHIDRLASQGMRFANHHCNSPVCTPSRQSFLTGQLPHAAGVTLLGTPLALDKPTLARHFQSAGYQTAVFGKMHFNRPGEPGLHGFDIAETEDVITKAWRARAISKPVSPEIKTKPAQWRPFQDPASVWLDSEKLPFARSDADMRGTYIASRAVSYLEANRDRPFALWVSLQEPHSPFDFPVEDRNRFNAAQFPAPVAGPEDAWQVPLIFRDLTPDQKRGIAASYYTSAAFLDRNVGRVLDALKRLRLEDDTLVVYTADHGYMLGQHGRFEKHCGYEPALRVPLIMRLPGAVRPGAVSELTEHIDLPATIVDMMNLPRLPVQHGQSLRPYLEGRAMEKPRDHIFSEYLENEEAYIKTKQWKFIFCSGQRARTDGYQTATPTPGRYKRLYDLTKDPGEFQDVAKSRPELVAKFEALMLARYRATHPDQASEPRNVSSEQALEFYLRPRDAAKA